MAEPNLQVPPEFQPREEPPNPPKKPNLPHHPNPEEDLSWQNQPKSRVLSWLQGHQQAGRLSRLQNWRLELPDEVLQRIKKRHQKQATNPEPSSRKRRRGSPSASKNQRNPDSGGQLSSAPETLDSG